MANAIVIIPSVLTTRKVTTGNVLRQGLTDAELVRAHVAWTLGCLGGIRAKYALEASLAHDRSTPVIDEITGPGAILSGEIIRLTGNPLWFNTTTSFS